MVLSFFHSVTVAVDAVVYYKIHSPLAAVCNVSDYASSTKLLASTTLRTILGTKNLSEILSDRETISQEILLHIDEATDPWGIKVMYNMSFLFLPIHTLNTINISRQIGFAPCTMSAAIEGRSKKMFEA